MSVTESQKRLNFIKLQSQDIKQRLTLNINSSFFWKTAKLLTNVGVV